MTTREQVEERLEEIYRLLADADDGLTSGQIGIRLGIDAQTVLRSLRRMEEREWVTRDRPTGAGVRWMI